jgi:inner membrane protein
LLWRVVAMTPDGFLEGEYSLVADRGPMAFRRHVSDPAALQAAAAVPDGARLLWFNHHFAKAEVRDGRLVLTDLRMGLEPDYTFSFAVAERDGDRWTPITPQQLHWPVVSRQALGAFWQRIWRSPQHDAAPLNTRPPAPG